MLKANGVDITEFNEQWWLERDDTKGDKALGIVECIDYWRDVSKLAGKVINPKTVRLYIEPPSRFPPTMAKWGEIDVRDE